MKTRPNITFLTAVCLIYALISPAVFAAPPGQQLTDQVKQAYQNTDQYDATVRFQLAQIQGRWTITQAGDYFIAVDKSKDSFVLDAPDQLLVADGDNLYYRNEQLPGKHLQAELPDDLTMEWVLEQVPYVTQPLLPTDIAMLLATDPFAVISDGASQTPATLPAAENDPKSRPRIQIAMQAGTLTLTINPDTYLIDSAVVDVDTTMLGAPAGTSMSYRMDFDVHGTNQPLGDDRFTFDTTNSQGSPTMQEMVASGSNAPHPLEGQPTPALNLPDVEGDDYDIAGDDAQVIVLDFWATWCGPCVAALPELQEVYDWAQNEGKPIAIYAVNQGETVEQVKQFWQDQGLSIPVLMDSEFVSSQAFQVNGIPQTVIIADGKVQTVHVGYVPGIGEQIKAEIQGLLDSDQP